MNITKDHVVSFDYQLTNSRSEMLDSSEDSGPLSYLHGYAHIIPGLEKALEGKKSGDNLNVVVPPVEAYGLRDERRMGQVERSIFPEGADIQPGMRFRATSENGSDLVMVVAVEGDTITVDANHPLAGETLTFDVTIREVRPATADELSHGHVHGEGCCGGHDHNQDSKEECCGGGGCH